MQEEIKSFNKSRLPMVFAKDGCVQGGKMGGEEVEVDGRRGGGSHGGSRVF